MLRVVPPLLLGVATGRILYDHALNAMDVTILLTVCLLLAFLCALIAWRKSNVSQSWKRIFSFIVFSFLFVAAMLHSYRYWKHQEVIWTNSAATYMGVLVSPPKVHEKSVSADVVLMPKDMSHEVRRVQLFFERTSSAEQLIVGDVILGHTKIRSYVNKGNPFEFDNRRYQENRGMQGLGYLSSEDWRKHNSYSVTSELSLWERLKIRALQYREKWIRLYDATGLDGENLAFYAALTLGDKSRLTKELRDDYARGGVSHILALSGMHLGFLVAFFSFFLSRWRWRPVLRAIGGVLVLCLVWSYVFITGLPTSLVRSAIMYSFLLVGMLMGRQGFSLNSLGVSAVVLIVFSPNLLYDVGFQLSFLSMSGILFLMPKGIRYFCHSSNRGVDMLVRSLLMSFSAQLFTVPLLLYVFGSFALTSALVTLLITPLTALLIYGMPLLPLSFVGCPRVAVHLSSFLSFVMDIQNKVVSWFASLPFVVETYLSWRMLLMMYLFLFALLSFFYLSRARWLKVFLFATTCLLLMTVYESFCTRTVPQLVFYNNPSAPAMHIIFSEEESYLLPVADCEDDKGLSYIATSFWKRRLQEAPVVVMDTYESDGMVVRDGIVNIRNDISVVMLADNRWKGCEVQASLETDFMYVTEGFAGALSEMAILFQPKCVVLDASLPQWKVHLFSEECKDMGWFCYDMNVKGALKVALK